MADEKACRGTLTSSGDRLEITTLIEEAAVGEHKKTINKYKAEIVTKELEEIRPHIF